MLSYLANSVCTEIQMAVHQMDRFSMNPMISHEVAIVRIGQYLVNNLDRGLIYTVNKSRGLEIYLLTQIFLVVGIWHIQQMRTMFYPKQDS